MLNNPSSGHAPGLPTVTRRALLAVPALFGTASVSLAVPMPPLPGALADLAESPIQRLYRQHTELEAYLNGDGSILPEPEWKAEMARLNQLEEEIASQPITCTADLAAKVLILSGITGRGEGPNTELVVLECEALVMGGPVQ